MIYNTTTGCLNHYSDGWYELCGTLGSDYSIGIVQCDPANPTAIVDVTNPTTDRWYGASFNFEFLFIPNEGNCTVSNNAYMEMDLYRMPLILLIQETQYLLTLF